MNTNYLHTIVLNCYIPAKLSDEILELKIQIEKADSRIILYEQTLQSHKLLVSQLSLMKGDPPAKESHINLLMV